MYKEAPHSGQGVCGEEISWLVVYEERWERFSPSCTSVDDITYRLRGTATYRSSMPIRESQTTGRANIDWTHKTRDSGERQL